LLSDRISSLNLPAPLIVESGTSVSSVVEQVKRSAVGCVLICNGPKLAGIMTERDVLLKIVARDVDGKQPVDDFMTADPITLTAERTIGEAITIMDRENFRHIPIIDEKTGQPVSIFSIMDVINFLAESFPESVINLPPRPHQKILTPEGA